MSLIFSHIFTSKGAFVRFGGSDPNALLCCPELIPKCSLRMYGKSWASEVAGREGVVKLFIPFPSKNV